MSVTAQRSIHIQLTGDIEAAESYVAAVNTTSPGQIEVKQLVSGTNTITPPTSAVTARACTILPPASNTLAITLKGIGGDTGVALHPTDPTTIALNSTTGTFVLSVTTTINGTRLIWT